MCNLGVFTALVYSSPSIFRAQGILRNLSNMYDGLFSTELCVTLVFRTLSNIYDTKFYSQPCVTLAYLEPWYIQNPTLISVLPNIYHEIFYAKLCVTLTFSESLVYSELWFILKSKHI